MCAGSLLGVAINRDQYSFPVGNVDSMTLFPLDFEEFLWAMNEDRLCKDIRESFESNQTLPTALHEKALDLYRIYLIVGGMPRASLTYVETGHFLTVPDTVHGKFAHIRPFTATGNKHSNFILNHLIINNFCYIQFFGTLTITKWLCNNNFPCYDI